jgi:hypothetical protein
MKAPLLLIALTMILVPKVNYGQAPDLGVTYDFALFTAVGAFDVLGASVVNGDVGTDVGAFNGFPPGVLVGNIHVADPVSAQAAIDVADAYSDLFGLTCGTVLGVTLGSGQVLTPDIYCIGAAATLNGTLVLDAQGDPDAIFVFQIDGALATGTFANVVLQNAASLCNVYWQINGAFTLGNSSVFRGTAITNGAIHLLDASTVLGRVLSQAGAIDIHDAIVTVIFPPIAPVITADGPTTFCAGDSVILSGNVDGVWSNGSLNLSVTVFGSGDYYVVNTNDCGSDTSNHITVVVNPDIAPTITCPADVNIQCLTLIPAIDFSAVVVTDDCGTATVTFDGDVISNITCVNRFTITRTYRATDPAGHSATCTQTINVFDNTAPLITCPANVTVPCAVLVPAVDLTAVVTSDNCGGAATVTFVGDVVSNQTCANRFTITRTYRSTDACGNFADCNQTITVLDITPPSITCPLNVTVACASLVPAANPAGIVTSASCGGTATVTFVADVISNQTCANQFTLTRTYRSTDDCGNIEDCDQTITVLDNTPPSITCPVNVTVGCASLVPATNPIGIVTADNCGGTATVAFVSDVVSSQTCANRFTVTRTYRSTDACGNFADCIQTITVLDNTAPSITCPANVTVGCASLVPATNPIGIVTADNCGGTATVAFVSDVVSSQTCANRFIVTRTYRSTDACGNFTDCNQTITVLDNTPPSIACPSNVTVSCANLVPAANPNGIVTADNCGGTATVAFISDVISNQTCANRFTVTRTYRSTDACGNFGDCIQTITVLDNTPPSITCPANVTVACASLVPIANPSGIVTADNCGGTATVSFFADVISNQVCANNFILTRTYRSTDACGNFADCNQTIIVLDNTPPSITCPANVTVGCANLVPAANPNGIVNADNCGGTATVAFVSDVISNQTCANRFTLTRSYRATDACGNTTNCNQTITVFDNTPPFIGFVNPLIGGNGDTVFVQCFGQDPNWDLPVFDASSVNATDNCNGNVSVTFSQVLETEGDCSLDGFIILNRLTWTATDECGNSSTAYVFMAMIDTIPPVIHGVPADITVDCNSVPAPPVLVFATDECLCACVIFVQESVPVQGCRNGQVIVRSWTARDRCGNESVESQNITLVNDANPVLQFVPLEMAGVVDGTILEYTCNEGGIPAFFDLLGAASLSSPATCGGEVTISFNKDIVVPVNCDFAGYEEQQTFHWTAFDNCGNESSLTLIARLIDREAPVLIGVPEIACINDPRLKEVDATDNCGNPHIRFWDVIIPNPCGEGTALRRTYEVFDDCGNMSRDTTILMPSAQLHPTMSFINPALSRLQVGEDIIVNCVQSQGHYTTFGPEDITFESACKFGSTVTFTERLLSTSDCSTSGLVAVVELKWEVTDFCGNTTALIINANIVDESNPVFAIFSPEVTIGCNDKLPDMVATDNCGDVFMNTSDSIVNGPCVFEYTIYRIFTATDPCGNSATVLQTVHVGDGKGPVFNGVVEEVCDDLTLPDVTAYDLCAGQYVDVEMTEDTLDVTCRNGYIIQRIWSAVGACGIVSHITQLITVGDTTPPEIVFPTNSILYKYMDTNGNLINLSETDLMNLLNVLDANSVFVVDDCGQEIIPVFTEQVVNSDSCEVTGFKERRTFTWTATDICGNSVSIGFSVDIMDDIPPVFVNAPSDTTIVCVPLFPAPVVNTDDTSQLIPVVYTQTIVPGEEDGVFIVTRQWIATDACGNSSVIVQHITWIPESLLTCEIILPESIECNSHGVIVTSVVTGGFGPYTYEWQIVGEKCFIQGGQGTPEVTIYVGWADMKIILTVTDAFGCVSMCMATWSCLQSAGSPLIVSPVVNSPLSNPEIGVTNSSFDVNNEPGASLKHLNLWPNPANGSVNLSFESTIDENIHVTLTDFLGQLVFDDQINARIGNNNQKIDVAFLTEGSYLMQIKSDHEMHTKMVVILRNN